MPCSYTNIAGNVFFKKKKGNKEEQTAQTTKSLTVEVRGLGLQGGWRALPWAPRSAQATAYSGTLTEAISSRGSYGGSRASPPGEQTAAGDGADQGGQGAPARAGP